MFGIAWQYCPMRFYSDRLKSKQSRVVEHSDHFHSPGYCLIRFCNANPSNRSHNAEQVTTKSRVKLSLHAERCVMDLISNTSTTSAV